MHQPTFQTPCSQPAHLKDGLQDAQRQALILQRQPQQHLHHPLHRNLGKPAHQAESCPVEVHACPVLPSACCTGRAVACTTRLLLTLVCALSQGCTELGGCTYVLHTSLLFAHLLSICTMALLFRGQGGHEQSCTPACIPRLDWRVKRADMESPCRPACEYAAQAWALEKRRNQTSCTACASADTQTAGCMSALSS